LSIPFLRPPFPPRRDSWTESVFPLFNALFPVSKRIPPFFCIILSNLFSFQHPPPLFVRARPYVPCWFDLQRTPSRPPPLENCLFRGRKKNGQAFSRFPIGIPPPTCAVPLFHLTPFPPFLRFYGVSWVHFFSSKLTCRSRKIPLSSPFPL